MQNAVLSTHALHWCYDDDSLKEEIGHLKQAFKNNWQRSWVIQQALHTKNKLQTTTEKPLGLPYFHTTIPYPTKQAGWGQEESAGPYRGHFVTERQHWFSKEGSSYSLGAADADYSLSLPKTICAWWRATSYKMWLCCAEHSGSKGVNLEKQSPILRCECCA